MSEYKMPRSAPERRREGGRRRRVAPGLQPGLLLPAGFAAITIVLDESGSLAWIEWGHQRTVPVPVLAAR
jgi:hypothetical protein